MQLARIQNVITMDTKILIDINTVNIAVQNSMMIILSFAMMRSGSKIIFHCLIGKSSEKEVKKVLML